MKLFSKALAKLRNGSLDDIEKEAAAIASEVGDQDVAGDVQLNVFELLKSPFLYLQLFVVICMHLSQQLSGIFTYNFINRF